MELKKQKTKNTLELPQDLGGREASELKEVLLQALADGKPLTLNAKKVGHIETVCAQVILSAAISFSDKGAKFEVSNESEAWQKNFSILGLENSLSEIAEGHIS